jgi:hypothetical protein
MVVVLCTCLRSTFHVKGRALNESVRKSVLWSILGPKKDEVRGGWKKKLDRGAL